MVRCIPLEPRGRAEASPTTSADFDYRRASSTGRLCAGAAVGEVAETVLLTDASKAPSGARPVIYFANGKVVAEYHTRCREESAHRVATACWSRRGRWPRLRSPQRRSPTREPLVGGAALDGLPAAWVVNFTEGIRDDPRRHYERHPVNAPLRLRP